MVIGLQISSLKPYIQTEADLDSTLRRIKEIGYSDVQLQWTGESIKYDFIKRKLDEYGIANWGTQDYYQVVMPRFEYELEAASAYGSKYICVSGIPEGSLSIEGIDEMADRLRAAQERARQAGAVMTFHPRAQEYVPVVGIDGMNAAELLLSKVPQMQLTLDVWHSFLMDLDTVGLIEKYEGRLDIVHLKNGVSHERHAALTTLDKGVLDLKPIVAACKAHGVKAVMVEQESWDHDAFECMDESLRYVKSII